LGARTADLLIDYDALSDELAFCRIVDNYLLYVSELLALIFKTKPDALKSDEKVSIEMILGHATIEDLIEGLTERRVLSLSLKSVFALNNYLTRRLSFRLAENDVELQTLVEIVENRNLYVHNRGVVNRHYLNRLPNSSRKVGESLNAREQLGRGLDVLPQSVFLTDARAAAKFHIPRTEAYTPIRSPILGF
jgi:hypothetical protein